MVKYEITWTNGVSEIISGINYINALRVNHISEDMEHNIIDYKPIGRDND